MIEEVEVSVVRRRPRVLAGLGTVDYVILPSPSGPAGVAGIVCPTTVTRNQKGDTHNG